MDAQQASSDGKKANKSKAKGDGKGDKKDGGCEIF